MNSKVKTVTEYMKEVSPDHLDTLTELREICLQTLQGFRESMEFGMPSYSRDTNIAVAWDSQKNQITLYINDELLLKKFRQELKGLETGKNWIRFKKTQDLNLPLISRLLRELVIQKDEVLV